ncbi:MAG TPA: TauD/TfdA family dioxygenase [Sphingomonadaceae bacterium]|jgi:alpha-ketoglutarate-dependent 2,4-dichlorophenoxyacetate dioxygenase|nr:TauD/TfdA family dioxygenase [Sphingomonadaceae bacterium]
MPEIRPLHPLFAAEVVGLDLSRLDAALAETCFDLFDRYAVCVFRDSGLDDAAHVAFSRLFGELEHAPHIRGAQPRFPFPELFDAGNLDAEGNIRMAERSRLFNKGNQQWHTDSSFRPERSSYSLLLAHLTPPSGADTQFADMRAAYRELPDALRDRIQGLEAEHSIWHSRQLAGYPEPTEVELSLIPGAVQPLVLQHPRTGNPNLYLAKHASHIVGMPREEGGDLLSELIDFATQPRFVYSHQWREGDLVVWDNRCTMHRATPFEDTVYPRDMRRTTVRDRPLGDPSVAARA